MEAFAFIGGLSPSEMLIVLVLGLLLFGSRLPQVGRSLGKSLAEFKRGLRGFETDMHAAERDIEHELDIEEDEQHKKQALLPPIPEVEEKKPDQTPAPPPS